MPIRDILTTQQALEALGITGRLSQIETNQGSFFKGRGIRSINNTLPDDKGNVTLTTSSALIITEVDGAPSGTPTTLKFTNGSVTDNGDGSFTVTTGAGGGGDFSSNTSSSVDSEIILFSGTGGKTGKRATGSGIAKLTSGVLSAVTAPSGTIVGDTDSQTLTNKTLTTPTIGDFTNATHNHTNNAGGGTLTHSAISDFDAQVRTSTLNQMTAPTADLSINTHKLTSVTDPTSAQDAATKAYVDSAIAGTDYKEACKYASTAALPTVVYANGSSGVGATLTGASVGALSIDSSSPSVGQRILIKNQVDQTQNGIYTVTATGSGIAVFVMTRTTDFDQSADITDGDATYILSGTVNSGSTWVQVTTGTITVGSSNIVFSQIAGPGSILAGTGISVSGLTISIDTSVTVDKTTAQTLTNKRITDRTGTTTSSATPTINTDNVSFYSLTAQTTDITSFTTNLSGTPAERQTLWIAITGTAARAITWGASFEASTVALPTTTVTTARLDVGFVWNTVTTKWRCVATC